MGATAAELRQAREHLHGLGAAGKRNFDAMIKYVRLVRELSVHDAEGIAEYGSVLLAKYKSKLSDDEVWQLHEDVALACAAVGATQAAMRCADACVKQFPDSVRAKVLRGAVYEASGSFDAAAKLYDDLLQQHPANAVVMKRQVALHLGRGDVAAATDALVAYLDVHQTDRAGWQRLCGLYASQGLLEQARFCLEEVLVHVPGDVITVVRLADMLYAQGGAANVSAALAYYSKVISLSKGGNVRALYGALASACYLGGLKGSREDHQELVEVAGRALLQMYERMAPDKVPLVRALLASQTGA